MLKAIEPYITARPVDGASKSLLRSHCTGVVPLPGRLEDWMVAACLDGRLPSLVQQHGSPLNLHCTAPFDRNVQSLRAVAGQGDFEIYFARKANKCLSFVDAARELGCGVDVASENELAQTLQRGVHPSKIICTAAVKNAQLLHRCLKEQVVLAVDNHDELSRLQTIAIGESKRPALALRVGGFTHQGEKLPTRFGFDIQQAAQVVRSLNDSGADDSINLVGVQFHLDGYSAEHRISAIRQCLELIDQLRDMGHDVRFLDIGGGFPISYLESEQQWTFFWDELGRALRHERRPITYRNHGLGLVCVANEVHGTPNSYPYFQTPVGGEWLGSILEASVNGKTIAQSLRVRDLQLRCEPGRSILDGCGMTVATVEFLKQQAGGEWLIGLSMNHTQCRTSSDDFLVDPLLVRRDIARTADAIEGYLVGQYCTESELICLRQLRFSAGVAVGDLVLFPNTAGYFMHFLESQSHQFSLAQNVFIQASGSYVDPIDSRVP